MGSMSDGTGQNHSPASQQASGDRPCDEEGRDGYDGEHARVRRWAVTACVVASSRGRHPFIEHTFKVGPLHGWCCSVSIKRLSFWPESRMQVLGGDDHATRRWTGFGAV